MRHPALVVSVPFVMGLALGGTVPASRGLADLVCAAGLGSLATVVLTRRSRGWCWAGALVVALGAGGAMGARDAAHRHQPPLRQALAPHLARAPDEGPVVLTGVLRADAQPGRDGGAILVVEPRIVGGAAIAGVQGPRLVRISIGGTPPAPVIAGWREGSEVRLPVFLRVPSTYRNPGVEDAALGLARRDIALVGSAKSAALVEVVAPAPPLDAWAADVRAHIRTSVAAALPGATRAAAVCVAILIGDRAGLDDDTVERLRRAGTFHVIAISGGNVALFTGACVMALRALRVRPRVAAVAAIGTLAAFALVVERSASVDRALTVAVLYLVAHVADHRASPLNVVGFTALASGGIDPALVFDVGALLTFGATAGLLVGASATSVWLRARAWQARPTGPAARLGELVIDGVAATLAAEAAVVPISAAAFGQFTLAGLVLNLVAIPAMAVVQFGGMALVAATPAVPLLAATGARCARVAADVLVDSSALVEVAPWLVVETPSVAALVRAPAPAIGPPGRGPLLVVSFLDVGQGDATLVQFPSGAAMLVDAGGAAGTSFDIGGRVIVPAVRALGVDRLTWLALTHGDPDHISGAGRVVERLRPVELWEGVPVARHAPLAEVLAVAQQRGIAIRNVIAGDVVRVDGVEVRLVWPPPATWERQRVRNDDSIVIELRYGDVQFFLPGDIGDATEGQVLARVTRGGRVVVKAAHHGSRTSSGRAWVSALRPDVVVYSAGRDNRFGHPAPDVAARYAHVGAEAFRTDRDGAISVATDGTQLWAVTMDGRRWWKGGRR